MKTNKLPSLISILILTLLTSVLWVSFNVYRALTAKPDPAVSAEILKPLTPSLDIATINQIRARVFLDESQIPENAVIAPSLPSPTPIPTPTASPEGELTQ